ncbi:MAG TPA: protein kinase [Vicinamibacteria bacterium]|nr:protein kinase [Vicinamibacteria bacterium]
MALAPGTRLGPYEILSLRGHGGMGEVYEAQDSRLGRRVAIKTVPPAFAQDAGRLRRFEQEARAAGTLSHPNLVVVFDVGRQDDTPYIVSELLDGASLREVIEGERPSLRRALDYAGQMARGLAAAHEKGIVHRDLKPENVFVTRDGLVKILDFGIAKLRPEWGHGATASERSTLSGTMPGAVMGTVGYMSPEQVKGLPVDHRSDLFSLGTVLFELFSGRRAFRGETAPEVMTAILREDPPDLTEMDPAVPTGLARVVRRCLEKRPEERFDSARDVAFSLEALSSGGSAPGAAAIRSTLTIGRRARRTLGAALLTALVGAAFLVGRETSDRPPLSFQRLTFRRGHCGSAQFAPDGQTIVYGAAWDGQPARVFSTRTENPESRALDLPDADALSVSSRGEIAVLLRRSLGFPSHSLGTLARVPLAGGAPRELLEDVQGADWSPDGTELAVVRVVGGKRRLEYPVGRVLYEASHVVMAPRVSPDGDRVAFVESDATRGDEYRSVSVVDRRGEARALTNGWRWLNSLGWSPRGDEVWFPASEAGPNSSLWGVALSGRKRLLARLPAFALLHDVSPEGRALVSLSDVRAGVMGVAPGETHERDLSWLDLSSPADLSPDGRTLVGIESGEGTRRMRAIYVRKTDGLSPAVRVGDGFALALSPDSKWVLAQSQDHATELMLLPTGAGETKAFGDPGIEYGGAAWAAGGTRVLLSGRHAGQPWRSYVMDATGGEPRAVTPEGVVADAISPDGLRVAARDAANRVLLHSVEGGEPQVVPVDPEPGQIAVWSADGRSLFVTHSERMLIRVFRLDLSSGRREAWREITPGDPAGIVHLSPLLCADGRSYVYSYWRSLGSLYLVDGLR